MDMKLSLKDYVECNRRNFNFDYISKELNNRCESFRHRKFGYIYEGSGIFSGNNLISKLISRYIEKLFITHKDFNEPIELNFTYEELSKIYKFKRFFDILFITVIKDKRPFNKFGGDGYYNPDNGDKMWDDISKKFGIVEITINLPYDNFDENSDCTDLIEHELNHVYDDYYRHLHGKSMYQDKIKQIKFINKKKISEKELVQSYLSKSECNAYLAQIEGELSNKMFSNYAQTINWLDNHSNGWDIYKQLKYIVDKLDNKKIYNLYCKTWNKFINHLSFILKDHISEEYIMEKSHRNDLWLQYIKQKL